MAVYRVPTALSGMTLSDFTRKYGGDIGTLGNILGISGSTPLTEGQQLITNDLPGINPSGSGEYQLLNKYFTPESTYQQNQQDAFTAKQEAKVGAFTDKLNAVPEQLQAVQQALGIPEAYQTYGAAGQEARNVANMVSNIRPTQEITAKQVGISAPNLEKRIAAKTSELQPTLTAASQGLESAGSTLTGLLGQYQTETSNIFTPLQIEAGLLGDTMAQEFDLFKTNIQSSLDRELAQLSSKTSLTIADLNRANDLAKTEAAASQGSFQDLGDRVVLIDPTTGKEIASFNKGKLGSLDTGW